LRIYLDASILIALLTNDAHQLRATETLGKLRPVPVVSDLASLEFASAIARRFRTRELSDNEARAFLGFHDAWVEKDAEQVSSSASDIVMAKDFISRLDLNLRTADAIHIASCRRLDLPLWTFDVRMADCARKLGLDVLEN
jgi:predicted nucleic acid-binding protein